jgi:hypothetical protein
MVDPVTAYQVAHAGYVGGKFVYKVADKKVARYAEENGISKSEAWALVRQEAVRRGDKAVANAAKWAEKNPALAAVVIAANPGLAVPLFGPGLMKRFRK